MTATTQAPVTAPGSTAHTDGAWAVIPVQTRSERPRSFDPADFEVPTGREVNWKHTPVDRVAALFEDAAGPHGIMAVERNAGDVGGAERDRIAVRAPRNGVRHDAI